MQAMARRKGERPGRARTLWRYVRSRGGRGFVVTSGVFTKDAWKFAKGTSVRLIDGNRLIEWFGQVPAGEQNPTTISGTSAAVLGDVTAVPGEIKSWMGIKPC